MVDFRFDPNSTKNQGRWRLRNPNDFREMWTETNTGYDGINYIVGILEDDKNAIQAIRFNKNIWSENKANDWWQEHKSDYCKKWTEEEWQKWGQWQIEKIDKGMKRLKIKRSKGLIICKRLSEIMKLTYITPSKITIDYKYEKDCLIPVGSIRQNKEIIGDIDIIITCKITKGKIAYLNNANIREISGGEKRIDFKYFLREGYVNVNVFVFTDAKTWGAALLHSSGPYTYNIRLRKKLSSNKWVEKEKKGKGWKLSQNGLINNEGKIIPTPTERILQQQLEVKERKPKER